MIAFSPIMQRNIIAQYVAQQATRPPRPLRLAAYAPANDKIAAFHASRAKVRALFGGNRSGKTESGSYEFLAIVREFPGCTAWACTVTNEMLGAILAKKLFQYLPQSEIASIAWHNKARRIPGVIRLTNGSEIVFKSYEQGREKFQGASVKVIWHDEESPHDIFEESLARLIDSHGFFLLTMTPLKGLTWVYDEIFMKPTEDCQHWTVSLLENRYIPDDEKQRYIARLGADEIQKRVYGQFMRLEGAVWKEFDAAVNLLPRFPIPGAWRRLRGIDFGYNNPFCCLWMAVNDDNEYIVYHEYYQAERLLKDHVHAIQEYDLDGIEGGRLVEPITLTVADHDAQDRAELEALGIPTVPAIKDVQTGIQTVNRLFKRQAHGRPRLYLFNDLTNTIREIQKYHYKPGKVTEEPEKIDDHACDTLRYLCMELESGSDALPEGGDTLIFQEGR